MARIFYGDANVSNKVLSARLSINGQGAFNRLHDTLLFSLF
jgi:hypothetical protein